MLARTENGEHEGHDVNRERSQGIRELTSSYTHSRLCGCHLSGVLRGSWSRARAVCPWGRRYERSCALWTGRIASTHFGSTMTTLSTSRSTR